MALALFLIIILEADIKGGRPFSLFIISYNTIELGASSTPSLAITRAEGRLAVRDTYTPFLCLRSAELM